MYRKHPYLEKVYQTFKCSEFVKRACEGGFSKHCIYAVRMADDRKSTLDLSDLANVWGLNLEAARNKTIKVTIRLCERQ